MVPCFQPINKVRSSYSGNKQKSRTTTVTLAHALRGLKMFTDYMHAHVIHNYSYHYFHMFNKMTVTNHVCS